MGNLFFQVGDSMRLGWTLVDPAVYKAIADENFSLQALKNIWRRQNARQGPPRRMAGPSPNS